MHRQGTKDQEPFKTKDQQPQWSKMELLTCYSQLPFHPWLGSAYPHGSAPASRRGERPRLGPRLCAPRLASRPVAADSAWGRAIMAFWMSSGTSRQRIKWRSCQGNKGIKKNYQNIVQNIYVKKEPKLTLGPAFDAPGE